MSQPEYDEDRVDPNHGDQNQQQEPEQLDLPDDLNLDQNEEDEGAGDEGESYRILLLIVASYQMCSWVIREHVGHI